VLAGREFGHGPHEMIGEVGRVFRFASLRCASLENLIGYPG
jgi:hypothetical protein